MSNVINLFERKLQKLTDEQIFQEAVRYGRLMERGFLTDKEKAEALIVFKLSAEKAGTDDFKKICNTAIKLLEIL